MLLPGRSIHRVSWGWAPGDTEPGPGANGGSGGGPLSPPPLSKVTGPMGCVPGASLRLGKGGHVAPHQFFVILALGWASQGQKEGGNKPPSKNKKIGRAAGREKV